MGGVEVTNEQFKRFNPDHASKFIDSAGKDHAFRGFPANRPSQPVIRVSWQEAAAFCSWLSEKTGAKVSLTTEAQWEWACRAGAATPFSFGPLDADFSTKANLADKSAGAKQALGRKNNLTPFPFEASWSDGQTVVADVGQFDANPWGLRDMHGNVAEWIRSAYRPYPYYDDDGRNEPDAEGLRVVRGGSWRDRAKHATASHRLAYQPWQRVFNVGFRIVLEE